MFNNQAANSLVDDRLIVWREEVIVKEKMLLKKKENIDEHRHFHPQLCVCDSAVSEKVGTDVWLWAFGIKKKNHYK